MEQQQQYVGIDLHRRRSVIVRRNEAGQTLETVRIDNDPVALAAELAKAGEQPDILIGCTGGGSNFGGLAFPFLREKLAGRMSPTICSDSGCTLAPWPRLDPGYCTSSCLATDVISANAISTVTRSLSRATPYRLWQLRLFSQLLSVCSVAQNSALPRGAN